MAKPSKLNYAAEEDGVTYFTAAKANAVYGKIDDIIDDYASISEGVDADTLEGSTKAEVQTHAPASHGNEAHSETYITIGDVPAGGSGADGKDGVGFKTNMLTLWDKSLGDVPDDFEEVSELTGTNFTIIKYVGGGNETTNITHNVNLNISANVTLTLLDHSGNTQVIFEGAATGNVPLVTATDNHFMAQLAKSTATDEVYIIEAYTPDGTELLATTMTAPGESNASYKFHLSQACVIWIYPDT